MNENKQKEFDKKSAQGQIESSVWRKNATLRNILDAMDKVNMSEDYSPKQKSALMQRIIDFGQQLSLDIYLGKREVPETDDNETIKEFNLRMQHNAYDKYHHDKYYGEPMHGNGYFDEKGKFVYVHHYTSGVDESVDNDTDIVSGGGSCKNPRWRPIPLREETVTPIPVPVHDDVVGPTNVVNNGDSIVPPIPVVDNGKVVDGVVTPTDNNNIVNNNDQHVVPPTTNEGTGDLSEATKSDDKKKRRWGAFLIPPVIVAATALGVKDCNPAPVVGPVEPQQDTTEHVVTVLSEAESNYLAYTTEKGKAMLNKQGIANYEEAYDNFVSNIDKIPEGLKELILQYNMGTAKDAKYGVDLKDNSQIAATTLILMAESYPNLASVIHEQIQNPGAEISDMQLKTMDIRCQWAKSAQVKHGGNSEGNQISTIDYGLYGADKDTGSSVKFESYKKANDYTHLVEDVFDYSGLENTRY